MDKGGYCLIFANDACTLEIGRLGPVVFPAGWHIYVGSALGPGGFARVRRHIRLSRERDRRPRWHVDRLLLADGFRLEGAVCIATSDPVECLLASALGGPSVPGFGCSDCDCRSHLFFRAAPPLPEILAAVRGLGLYGTSTTIK